MALCSPLILYHLEMSMPFYIVPPVVCYICAVPGKNTLRNSLYYMSYLPIVDLSKLLLHVIV